MADRVPEDIAEAESRPELEGRIDRLQAATDDAAGQVRNLYIAFLSFGLYLAITVGATTDEQLLRESPVRLPIVDVGLPLVAFYWIAPLLFVLFHLNLLMQLYLLSEKLHRLDANLQQLADGAQRERRATLSQFVFSQMLIGGYRHPLIRRLLDVIAWTTFVVLPIAVLLLTQIQFLPYHDPFTTWWQRCLIVLDLLLLWLLWLPAIEPTGRLGRQFRVVARRRSRRVLRRLGEPLDWPAWPAVGLLSLIRAVATLPARIRARLRGDPKRDWRLLRLQELSAVALLIAFLIAAIPGTFLAAPIDGLIGERGNLGVLNRNLSLREAELMAERPPPGLIENIGEEQAFEKYARGLDLRGRDLRFADLYRADLRKADLRDGPNLQGANLVQANLQDAKLVGSELRGADLRGADLQAAVLVLANLEDADLREADLQGAILMQTDLRGALLRGADLQGASLQGADLQGADLREADLKGADLGPNNPQAPILARILTPVELRDVDRRPANLEGADLREADFRGVNLQRASLQGAVLRNADLQGADLGGTDLKGADLRNAHLWRATIGNASDRDALWNLADIRDADIDPVDLPALIAEMQDRTGDERTRTQVIERLETALRDDDRPDLPSWQAQPNVRFEDSDPIPRKLGWAALTTTKMDYEEKLATILGDLACAKDAHGAVARLMAWRAIDGSGVRFDLNFAPHFPPLWEFRSDRLFSLSLVQRLTPDDPEACPAAAELPDRLRSALEQLPVFFYRADHGEPAPTPPGTPLQGPDTPSQEPQTSRTTNSSRQPHRATLRPWRRRTALAFPFRGLRPRSLSPAPGLFHRPADYFKIPAKRLTRHPAR